MTKQKTKAERRINKSWYIDDHKDDKRRQVKSAVDK